MGSDGRSSFFPKLSGLFALICVWAGALLYGPGASLTMRPFIADNLIVYSVGRDSPRALLTEGRPVYLPTYRPVTYLLNWLEYQIYGVRVMPYLILTMLLWLLAATAVFRLVRDETKVAWYAAFLSAAFLVDNRANEIFLYILERQTVLALLFGIGATAYVKRVDKMGPGDLVIIGTLLSLAGLSKEFGLVFCVFMPAFAAVYTNQSVKKISSVSAAAILVVLLLRSFVLSSSVVASTLASAHPMRNIAVNVGKALFAIPFPNLFDPSGVYIGFRAPVSFENDWMFGGLEWSLAILGFLGIASRFKKAFPYLVLVVTIAILNFGEFRHRNVVIGAFGWYVLAGFGMSVAAKNFQEKVRSAMIRRVACSAAILGAIAFLFMQAGACHRRISKFVELFDRARVEDSRGKYGIYPEVIDEVKARYPL